MRLAAVDVGTNTVRLLVAEADSRGTWSPVHRDRVVTRLGQGLHPGGELLEPAMERTLAALASFQRVWARFGVARVGAVGTCALREASNGDAFLSRVRERTGLGVEVVSGLEEARLCTRGIWETLVPVLRPREKASSPALLTVDVGGGSTEVALCREGEPLWMESLPVGVVRLTEAFLKSDPPRTEERQAMQACIESHVAPLAARHRLEGDALLVGTAGTVSTLGAMLQELATYAPERLHGYRLHEDAVAGLYETLCGMPTTSRLRLPGLEPGREDVIVAGAAVVLGCMRAFRRPEMIVSEGGLLEGILLREMERANVAYLGFRIP